MSQFLLRASAETPVIMDLTHFTYVGIPGQFHVPKIERRNRCMPHGRTVLFLLLAGPLTGCLTADPPRPISWLNHSSGYPSAPGPDLIHINVAILEVGVGDPYVNEELWTLADEQQLPPDRKALLRDNGVRIGQIR